MSLFFKNKKQTKNTSDNNISINTNIDVMYNIGRELGELKILLTNYNERLVNLEGRVKIIEKKLKKVLI